MSEVLGVRKENVVQIQFTETEEKIDAIKLKCKKQDTKSKLKVDGQEDEEAGKHWRPRNCAAREVAGLWPAASTHWPARVSVHPSLRR